MPTEMRRTTLILPGDLVKRLDFLKKEIYYARPQSEMLRELIEIGIQAKMAELEAR